MKSALQKTIRVVGIIITALAIPLSLIMLLAIQGLGSEPAWITALHIAWTLANLIAVPFILTGFVLRYNIKAAVYLALIHLGLTFANMGILIAGAVAGDISILLIVALPATFYIIGYALEEK